MPYAGDYAGSGICRNIVAPAGWLASVVQWADFHAGNAALWHQKSLPVE